MVLLLLAAVVMVRMGRKRLRKRRSDCGGVTSLYPLAYLRYLPAYASGIPGSLVLGWTVGCGVGALPGLGVCVAVACERGELQRNPMGCSLIGLSHAVLLYWFRLSFLSFSFLRLFTAVSRQFPLSSFALEISLAIISAIRTGVHGSFLSGFALEISLAIICAIRTTACFRQAEVPYCR